MDEQSQKAQFLDLVTATAWDGCPSSGDSHCHWFEPGKWKLRRQWGREGVYEHTGWGHKSQQKFVSGE